MGTRGRMEVWGSADIRTITHQQALKSLEETLIATKLTRIEFPRKVRHRRWSSWMIDGAIAGWGPAITWVSLLLVLFSMISNLLSRLSPSRSRCTPTVHNVHNVHNVHCTWHSSPLSSYPPSTESPITNPRPVGPLQRGGQRSLPERKSQRTQKEAPVFMNRSTQFTKDWKTGAFLIFGQFILKWAKRRRTIKL